MGFDVLKQPSIMDFEASGLGAHSYPIEVGYCLAGGERYCTLIRPVSSWTFWDQQAEQLHGISRQLLMDVGADVKTVARELNERLHGEVLYCDAWVVDKTWCNQIFAIAGVAPTFELHAIEHIQTECQYLCWDLMRKQAIGESQEHRHRASSDAQLIQTVYSMTRSYCEDAERNATSVA